MPNSRKSDDNAWLDRKLKEEFSRSLVRIMERNPKFSTNEALSSIEQEWLENNPYNPLKNGRCPINELPDELLTYIFQLGVELQVDEWDSEEGYSSTVEVEDEWEDVDEDEEDEEDDCSEDDSCKDSDESTPPSSTRSINEKTDEDDERDLFPFQILVSHVCRHWRLVALYAPNLWTTLKFCRKLKLDKAKAYISRSSGMPLTILFDCDSDADDLEEQNQQPSKLEVADCDSNGTGSEGREVSLSQEDLSHILDLLEPEVHRWGTLIFRASSYNHVQLLVSRLHRFPAAPLLKSFQVYIYEECDDYEVFPGEDKTAYLPFQGQAPNLKEAIFWGVHIDWDAATQNFLCDLEAFELSYLTKDVRPSYATFVQIIDNSPNLHTLTLSLAGPVLPDGVPFDSEEGWGREPLAIPSLKEFALQFHDPSYASALVQHFDLPNVSHLVLNFDEEDYSGFVQTLAKPVKGRTRSLLQQILHLKISGLPCDVPSVEALLSQLTAVKTLNLKFFSEEEEAIYAKLIDPVALRFEYVSHNNFAPSFSSPLMPLEELPKVFCPHLEEITTSGLEGKQLKALIIARRDAGAPLKKILVNEDDDLASDDESWIRENVDDLQFYEPSDSEDELM